MIGAKAVLSLSWWWNCSLRRASRCSASMSDLVAGKRAAAVRAVDDMVKVSTPINVRGASE